jgi:hypothetical protein
MLEHHRAALFISPMLKHRCAALFISPTPKHLYSTLFISSQSQKHPIPPSFSLPKQLCPALVSLFPPSSAATPFAATFPVAETPATFHFPPVAETPIVSNFSSVSPMLKHHCSAFFIPFPSSFSPSIIDETIPSSNCFASFVAETPFASNPSSFIHVVKHHLPQPFIIHP